MMCCCAEWLALSAALLLLTGGARGIRVCKEEGPRVVADVRPIKALGFRPEDCVQPVAVSVHCTENSMMIRARADLYGTGRLVTASELRLGTDSSAENCGAVQREDTELVITAGLHECGAELRVEDDSLVYSNTLFHVPTLNRFGIIRSVGVAIPVQCRYKRTHFVSSNIQSNLVSPAPTTPVFSPQYGFDDWMSLSLMDVFQSDDGVSVMASVLSARHSPVKLFLQRCVVMLRPDAAATPSCDPINHHGWCSDPGPPESPVSFLPDPDTQILRLKLNLHRSLRKNPNPISMFITCWMKTADSVQLKNSVKKACSYVGNRTHFVSSNIQSNLVSPAPTTPVFSPQYGFDDWMSLSLMDVFQSDDGVSVMASVLSARHSPVKLFLQRCVVMLRPDAAATPSCDPINHHGWCSDPGPPESPVSFLPDPDTQILRLKLNLHRSLRKNPNPISMFITCWMKTADSVQLKNSVKKACSYVGNSWRSVDGKHEVCECCDWK